MHKDVATTLLDRLLPAQPRLPLWLKLAFTGFMAVLVPIYWRDYGPANFLYYCDVALFFTLAALWLESPLLASAPLVGILLPQTLWIIDFFFELVGSHLTELTHYMFEEQRPLFTRLLSLFHFWLPLFLIGLVWRLGYDRRAFALWTVLGWALMGICYIAIPGPRVLPQDAPVELQNQPVNINYVFGFSGERAQTWLPADWYFTALVVAMPILIYLPSHLLLAWLFSKRAAAESWASST
jgi:hypothetical protein